MAYTDEDLANVKTAIRTLVAGTRTVSLAMGDKSIAYKRGDLPALQRFSAEMRIELGLATGTFAPRTYAIQEGQV